MDTILQISIQSGRVDEGRDLLRNTVLNAEDGQYVLTLKKVGAFKATRYKYYFDCVMFYLLRDAAKFYRMIDHSTGEQYTPRTSEEMHQIMKVIYNPVTIIVPGGRTDTVGGTTTSLSDREFIGQYLEQIISDHAGAPYLVEIPTIQEWAMLHQSGQWANLKK